MADAAASAPRRERPLSPHLSIYRWPVTMLTSIIHRVTGVGLGIGTLVMAWWLIATAGGERSYNVFAAIAGGWFGKLVLFGFTWALVFHLLNGIRHLVWDAGAGLVPKSAERSGMIVIALSVVLTIAVWVFAFVSMGGL